MTLTMHLAQVVEDDRAAQKILRTLLQADGFRVVVSDCCVRGEQDARLRPPDVMIVDLGHFKEINDTHLNDHRLTLIARPMPW